jgi:TonB family protein
MKSLMLRAVVTAVGLWTALYTYRLPSRLREARRAEVASDLWQSMHDPDRGSAPRLALHILLRLLLGLRDDLGWRFEQPTAPARPRARAAMTGCAAGVVALMCLSIFLRVQSPRLPPNVRTGTTALHVPPAPPPAPPGSLEGASDSLPSFRDAVYGQTTFTVATNAAPPVLIKAVRPVYPPIAVVNDVTGVVVVQATITEAGRVADARVVQAAGFLTQPAIDAVRQWEFAPGDSSGTVIKSLLTVKVKFTP